MPVCNSETGKYRSISAGGVYGYLAVSDSGFYPGGTLMVGIGCMNAKEDPAALGRETSSGMIAINVNLKTSGVIMVIHFTAV